MEKTSRGCEREKELLRKVGGMRGRTGREMLECPRRQSPSNGSFPGQVFLNLMREWEELVMRLM